MIIIAEGWPPMLFGTQVPPMINPFTTLTGWPLPWGQQPGQPQPMVSPSYGTDARAPGDRRPDSLLRALIVAALQTPIGKDEK